MWKAKGQVSQGGNFPEWYYVSDCLGFPLLAPLLAPLFAHSSTDPIDSNDLRLANDFLIWQNKRKENQSVLEKKQGEGREEKNETEIKERDVIPWSMIHDLEHFNGHSGAWITFRLRGRGRAGKQWKGGEEREEEGGVGIAEETGRVSTNWRQVETKEQWRNEVEPREGGTGKPKER